MHDIAVGATSAAEGELPISAHLEAAGLPAGTVRALALESLDRISGGASRLLVLGCLLAPVCAVPVLAYLHGAHLAGPAPLTVLGVCALGFWCIPLLVERGANRVLLFVLGGANALFAALFAATWFGGVNSPFIPVLVAACLVQMGRPSRNVFMSLCLALAAFAVAGWLLPAPPASLAPEKSVTLGVILLLTAAATLGVFRWLFAQPRSPAPGVDARADSALEDLRRAAEEAETANRGKSAFFAQISRLIRNPLNAIIGYSQMITEEANEGYNEQQLEDINRINIAGKTLLTLVAEVFDMTEIERRDVAASSNIISANKC